MSVADLPASSQNYLKVIWALQEWSETPVTTSVIAQRVGFRTSTVSDAIRKLTDQGLIEHAPYGTIGLTEAGRQHAVAMVRRHRLIETFLVDVLNYGWDEVHEEAEILEHAVSDLMVTRIDEFLGKPTRDPHGDPIPAADGTVHRPDATQLAIAQPGTTVRVTRISDSDPARLRYFADHDLVLDSELRILQSAPYSDTITVLVVTTGQQLQLGTAAANAVWVSTIAN